MHSTLVILEIVLALASLARTQNLFNPYYMYEPGTRAVFAPWDQFGGMEPCSYVQPSGVCPNPQTDITLCKSFPDNVTMTPYIDQTYRYGLASVSDYIHVNCDIDNRHANTTMTYTLDGTLPDIHKTQKQSSVYIPFNSSNPSPIIIVRCIDQGKLPSRIAYMQRMVWDDSVNGSYATTVCSYTHYKELDLPICDTSKYGALCDGQTIINTTEAPTSTTAANSPFAGNVPTPDASNSDALFALTLVHLALVIITLQTTPL